MLHSNGQCACPNCDSANTTVDARKVSENPKSLSPAQVEFLEFVMLHGAQGLSESLKLVHDIALYHSDITFDDVEKSALFDLRILWEGLEKIGGED